MSDTEYPFPDYESTSQEHPTEENANVRSMRKNRKRGRTSKQAKAAQMRRWRAKHSSSRSWRKEQARKKQEYRARKALEYANA